MVSGLRILHLLSSICVLPLAVWLCLTKMLSMGRRRLRRSVAADIVTRRRYLAFSMHRAITLRDGDLAILRLMASLQITLVKLLLTLVELVPLYLSMLRPLGLIIGRLLLSLCRLLPLLSLLLLRLMGLLRLTPVSWRIGVLAGMGASRMLVRRSLMLLLLLLLLEVLLLEVLLLNVLMLLMLVLRVMWSWLRSRLRSLLRSTCPLVAGYRPRLCSISRPPMRLMLTRTLVVIRVSRLSGSLQCPKHLGCSRLSLRLGLFELIRLIALLLFRRLLLRLARRCRCNMPSDLAFYTLPSRTLRL